MALSDCLQVAQQVKDELLELQQASKDEIRYTAEERQQITDVLGVLAKLADPAQDNPTAPEHDAAFHR